MLQLSKGPALPAARGTAVQSISSSKLPGKQFQVKRSFMVYTHRLHSALSISHAHKAFQCTSKVPHSQKKQCISQYFTPCRVEVLAIGAVTGRPLIVTLVFLMGIVVIFKKTQRKKTLCIKLIICLKNSDISCNCPYAQAKFLLQVCCFCHGTGSENTQAHATPRHIPKTLAS